MTQRTDLYSILISYANKNNSPYVDINIFLEHLGKYAKKQSADQPEWLKWVDNRNVKFWAEVSALAEENKCELISDAGDGCIYMPHFYLDIIGDSYSDADKDIDMPFPSEESLKIILPENQFKTLSSAEDVNFYLNDPQETDLPILKIVFPHGFGSALVLASLFPKRLMEMAILKIRNYLQHGGNKEYALRKLSPQLQGKENFLREQLNQLLVRPMETCKAVEDGKELTYIFWAHFCILVKNDIKKKKDYLSDDIAVLQSVYIVEVLGGYYKSLANTRQEEELAFRSLEAQLSKAPFLFTLEQILQFRNAYGLPLLGQYSKEGLDSWLKKMTTESKNNELPSLLIVEGLDERRYFCTKDKMLPLCFRLLADARRLVSEAVSKHWYSLYLDHKREPAMINDADFEKLLAKFTKKLCPTLAALLRDPKLLLIYDEIEKSRELSAIVVKIFNNGQLAPYSSLYLIQRKEMLTDIKLILPFWYSWPIITGIIAFFKQLFKRKENIVLSRENDEVAVSMEKNRAAEIRTAAEELETTLVPEGHTMDSYLEELEGRWSQLIDKKARDNLIEDVRSLIRDHLRAYLKLQKKFQLTRKIVNQIASDAIIRSPTLSSLSGRDSLILYSELYLVKLLQSIR